MPHSVPVFWMSPCQSYVLNLRILHSICWNIMLVASGLGGAGGGRVSRNHGWARASASSARKQRQHMAGLVPAPAQRGAQRGGSSCRTVAIREAYYQPGRLDRAARRPVTPEGKDFVHSDNFGLTRRRDQTSKLAADTSALRHVPALLVRWLKQELAVADGEQEPWLGSCQLQQMAGLVGRIV